MNQTSHTTYSHVLLTYVKSQNTRLHFLWCLYDWSPVKLRGTFLEAFYSPDAHICLKLILYFEKKRENRSQQNRVPYLVTIERTTFVSSTFCQLNVIAKDYSQIDVNFRTYYGFFFIENERFNQIHFKLQLMKYYFLLGHKKKQIISHLFDSG